MGTRRRLTAIRLDKIAAVDLPCQEHATVAILKRRPDPEAGPKGIAKATFEEALQAGVTADAVNRAFYESFDGLWERNEAFRTALTDELADGGDGTAASGAYVDSVKQLVDEAVSEARRAGVTAQQTDEVDKALSAAVEKWLETKKEQTTMKITNRAELQAAVSSFAIAKSTVADVQAIQKAAEELNAEDLLPADGPLAKAKPDPEIAKMRRELAVLKLSPEAKAHYDTLDEAGQTAFIGKSAADQAAEVEGATSKDPVVYKTKDGVEIRKSDGTAALLMAKRLDAQDEQIAKLSGQLTGESIEKRATEQYPNVAKAVAVDMLKSADQLGKDSDAGKAVLKSLDTMNRAGGRLMKTVGTTEDDGGTGADTIAKAKSNFDSEVAKIASRDKIGTADAMSKARVEFPDLWKQAFPDTAEAIEAHEVDAAVGD